jgi:hypothetical protein
VLCAGLVVAVAALWSSAARGDEPRIRGLELSWDAAGDCPERDAVLRSIAGFLPAPHAPAAAAVSAEIHVELLPDRRFLAHIALHGAALGTRRVAGADCRRVSEAAALIIAMTLDPLGLSERMSERAAAASERDALGFSLGLRAAGDLGSLPQPSLGTGFVLGVHAGRAHAEAEAMVWLPRLTRLSPESRGSRGSGEIGLFGAALRGCYDLAWSARVGFGFGPCLGAEAGLSTGRGIDVIEPVRKHGFWAAALAGLTVRQLGAGGPGLGSWLALEIAAPLVRPVYAIDGQGAIFRASALAARASVGVTWSFR